MSVCEQIPDPYAFMSLLVISFICRIFGQFLSIGMYFFND